jgi:phosphoribosylformimino-5-aminoimidazole carboxamide ribotide isomerase
MLIIPAIDLKDGCVVRFVQGRLDKKVYSRNPLKTAKHWIKQGAELLHIVDLDGAFSGIPKNLDIVKNIVRNVDVPIQFGGGIRKIEMIKALLDLGIQRVVLGTKAIEDKGFLKKAFSKFKERVIISIDAKGERILTKGWQASYRNKGVSEFGRILREVGFKQMIYTDTLKDGTLKGPSIKYAKKLLKETGMKIILSGGISSLKDIHRIKLLENQGLIGVIVGKALYEGMFTLPQASKIA